MPYYKPTRQVLLYLPLQMKWERPGNLLLVATWDSDPGSLYSADEVHRIWHQETLWTLMPFWVLINFKKMHLKLDLSVQVILLIVVYKLLTVSLFFFLSTGDVWAIMFQVSKIDMVPALMKLTDSARGRKKIKKYT